jgi:hypothetical protein
MGDWWGKGMISRTTVTNDIVTAIAGHCGDDFDAEEWLSEPENIALINDNGDVNLFTYDRPGVYIGHFFYASRGKEALRVAKQMLVHIFHYEEVEVIMGLTPLDKLGARWMARKLGFKSYGEVDTPPGRCELFILNRHEKDTA